jgi:hypothetical protein
LKIIGYTDVSVYFPCAIIPQDSKCILSKPPGSVKLVSLKIYLFIDRTPWSGICDAGSKPWLVAQAMNVDSADLDSGSSALYRSLVSQSQTQTDDNDVDVFHVRKPGDIPKKRLTEIDLEDDDEVLAEDKFHKKDAMSQYILQQRKEESKEKHDRHAKY